MARTNNLPNFLTDVASAIKTKKGDSTPILASDFDTEINKIETPSDAFSDEQFENMRSGGNFSIATSSYLPYQIIKKIPKVALDFTEVNEIAGFSRFESLEEIDVSLWNVSTITTFSYLFHYCSSLKKIDLSAWNVPTSSDASNHSLTFMFNRCSSLKEADLSCFKGAWNISLLMGSCSSLEKLDIRGLDLTNCTYVYTSATDNFLYNVPTTCEIIVADNTQKTFMNTTFSSYTNVKTVAEL